MELIIHVHDENQLCTLLKVVAKLGVCVLIRQQAGNPVKKR